MKWLAASLLIALSCSAQVTISNPQGRAVSQVEVQKVYESACAAVKREFNVVEPVQPRVTLELGAKRSELYWPSHAIRLKQWNPGLFADGVVMLAVDSMMTPERRSKLAHRAVSWAEATIAIEELKK